MNPRSHLRPHGAKAGSSASPAARLPSARRSPATPRSLLRPHGAKARASASPAARRPRARRSPAPPRSLLRPHGAKAHASASPARIPFQDGYQVLLQAGAGSGMGHSTGGSPAVDAGGGLAAAGP